MDKDAKQCKKRYEFLRLCLGGKGPIPWTRDEDKQILLLVGQHGKIHNTAILDSRLIRRIKE
jgi:hypothetical protein